MCTNCDNTTDGTVRGLCSTCYIKKYGDLDILKHDERNRLDAPVIRRLEALKNIVGKRAFTYLKRGGLLRIWKRSNPHNWWIETKSGEQLWHSDDGRDRQLPDIFLFNNVFKSDHTIPNGMTDELHYCLKDEYKNAL